MSQRRNPTVDELLAVIASMPLEARFIEDEEQPSKSKVWGLWEQHRITINEEVSLADSIIHEAMHEARKGWSERTVEKRAHRLLLSMSSDDVKRIHQAYQRRKRRVRRKRVI